MINNMIIDSNKFLKNSTELIPMKAWFQRILLTVTASNYKPLIIKGHKGTTLL